MAAALLKSGRPLSRGGAVLRRCLSESRRKPSAHRVTADLRQSECTSRETARSSGSVSEHLVEDPLKFACVHLRLDIAVRIAMSLLLGRQAPERHGKIAMQSQRISHSRCVSSERGKADKRTLSTSTRSPSLSGPSLQPGRTGASPSESSWGRARVSDRRPGELRDQQSCREVARRRESSRRL